MAGIATQLFRFATQARAERVWEALTRPELTARYLYGLAARSEWRPGAPVTFTTEEGVALTGEVLVAQELRRLSYTLQAGDGQPATYVTWEILGTSAGCVIRLYVDEPGEVVPPEGDVEAESAWLPVVAGLEAVLAPSVADRPGRRG
jgi:uncharacterized protein YndB with AHSA1/START domain